MNIIKILKENVLRTRTILSSFILAGYYWFLWQLDHHVAPYVWEYKGINYADGWIFEDILGKEFFEITSFYNFCILMLLFLPLLLIVVWVLDEWRINRYGRTC